MAFDAAIAARDQHSARLLAFGSELGVELLVLVELAAFPALVAVDEVIR